MGAFTLDELLSLEHDGWRALCSQRGGSHFHELMTPDAVMVLAHGMVLDRDAVVRSLDDAPPWARYELSDARLVDMGDDVSALVYRAESSRDDGSAPFTALMSSVYRRVGGRPRLTLYQQTTIPS